MPHRPSLGLFDNEVRLYSLDELTETVRLLERSQPGRTAAELSNAVFAELAMKRSRRAVELVAEAIRLARSREPREDIGRLGVAGRYRGSASLGAARRLRDSRGRRNLRTRDRSLQRDTSGPPLLTLCR